VYEARPPTRCANNWFVISGGPASGKTTLVNLLAARGYPVVHEHARQRIDRALYRGMSIGEVRKDQLAFQLGVLEMQLEHESNVPPEQLTFFDRGIPDTLAYQRFHHLPDNPLISQAVAECSYRKVFIMELLQLVPDYARTEDDLAQHEIQQLILDVYGALPFPLVLVPVLPPEERMEYVLARL
jgi:predicted ATPase